MKKLSDYLPTINDSIFSAFNNPIWATAFQDSAELDTYFYLRYGDRIGNKLINNYADEDTGIVDSTNLIHLAALVYSINSKKWEHLYKVYTSEYNPIENTDFVETYNDTRHNVTVGNSVTTGQMTTTDEGQTTGQMTNTVDNHVAGFNSVNNVNSSDSTNTTDYGTENGNPVKTKNTTTVDYGTKSGTPVTTDATGTGDTTIDHELHKHGNIGVTETVTMLEHEVEFWKWSFIDQVCKDICDIIALSIY